MNEQEPKRDRVQQQYDTFMDVTMLIESLSLERNKSIYFSSAIPKDLVDEVRANNPHLVSPWDTDAGKAILKLGVEQENENGIEWRNLSRLRNRLIHAFAERSSGNFTIVFPETHIEPDKSALSTIILEVLQRNRDVTTINNQKKDKVIKNYFAQIDSSNHSQGKVLQFRP